MERRGVVSCVCQDHVVIFALFISVRCDFTVRPWNDDAMSAGVGCRNARLRIRRWCNGPVKGVRQARSKQNFAPLRRKIIVCGVAVKETGDEIVRDIAVLQEVLKKALLLQLHFAIHLEG